MTAEPLSTVWWQCGRKSAYLTKTAAKAAKRRMEHATGLKYKRYRCPFCGHYHLAKRQPKG